MKQLLSQKGQTTVAEVPAPQLERGTILVRVAYSAISVGTEMSGLHTQATPIWKRAIKDPHLLKKAWNHAKREGFSKTKQLVQERSHSIQPLGYSAAGRVIAVAQDVPDFSVGDSVACAGNQCAYHAETIRVPENLAVPIPESVDLAHASTVALGAIALQGVRRLEATMGETFVVVGLGFLGQLIVQMLQAHGCKGIGVDLDSNRLALSRKLGATMCLNPLKDQDVEQVFRITDGVGADGVIVAAATKSDAVISSAFRMCRRKGRVVLVGDVGLNIDRNDMYVKELDFRISTSYGPGRYDERYEEHGFDYPLPYVRWTERRNMSEYLRLLAENRIQIAPLISTIYPLENATEAYGQLKSGTDRSLMILLKPDGNRSTQDDNRAEDHFLSTTIARQVCHVATTSVQIKRINLAVIGPGKFAREVHLPHLQKLSDRFSIQAVVSRSGHVAHHVGKQYKVPVISTDYKSVLANNSIDAVLISTRHHLHAGMVLDALQAGKHVLVEKPLCLTQKELEEIATFFSENEASPALLTGFNRRFSPHIGQIKNRIEERTNPIIVNYVMNAGHIPSDHWVHGPEGGGRNLGEACHIYDLFTSLAQSRVKSIVAHSLAPTTQYYRADDNFVATMTFEDGSVATLTYASLGHRDYPKESMQLFVDGKVFELADYKTLYATGEKTMNRKKTRRGKAAQKGHLEELLAFANCIQNGGEWPIPLWQQIQATEIALEVDEQIKRAATVR